MEIYVKNIFNLNILSFFGFQAWLFQMRWFYR